MEVRMRSIRALFSERPLRSEPEHQFERPAT